LVDQAVKLFGAQHYDHYDFLLTISDNLGGIGLEHHEAPKTAWTRLFHRIGQCPSRPQSAAPRNYPQLNGKFPPRATFGRPTIARRWRTA